MQLITCSRCGKCREITDEEALLFEIFTPDGEAYVCGPCADLEIAREEPRKRPRQRKSQSPGTDSAPRKIGPKAAGKAQEKKRCG